MMKKVILLVLTVISMQIFSVDYKVIKAPSVKLSQKEIQSSNLKIEEGFKNFVLETKNTLNKNVERHLSDKKYDKEEKMALTFLYSLISLVFEVSKIEIKEIKYISDNKAEVIVETRIPSIDLIDEKKMEEKIIKEIGKNKNFEQFDFTEEEFKKVIKILENEIRSVKEFDDPETDTLEFNKVNGKWTVKDKDLLLNFLN